MDFEAFRPDLDKALAYADGRKGGHHSFDLILMLKILVVQPLNNLSDTRREEVFHLRQAESDPSNCMPEKWASTACLLWFY